MAELTTDEKRPSVRGLGEIALRVNNLDAMQKFYEEAIGLPLMTRFPNCAFFEIADTGVTDKLQAGQHIWYISRSNRSHSTSRSFRSFYRYRNRRLPHRHPCLRRTRL
jgi:catechol 2,3-dioxygenase-like lactoylglutathione lyase family enzyme